MKENQTQMKKPRVERVALRGEALDRVDAWLAQAQERFKGIHATRAEIVEFIVLSSALQPDDQALSSIGDRYYDQHDMVRWISKEIMIAKRKGIQFSLDDVLLTKKSDRM